MRCKPLAVSTTSLSCPTFSANAASSNSFCITPRPKHPRSPNLWALLQSDSRLARLARVSSPDLILRW